ncbi:SlyX family protein [Pontivivens nitratireducens]|uniref:SlyX family protein n=1 Tax=Pontivivens nitratireducens TaxID=2758038 RepID=A0A6G7VK97_9RHOB|nr:SlyX family protein [Pontibrevibacter nitratireducens]QIK40285.1 SlyX family protein [Pontibrevibacter nitratireducens]
MSDTVRMQEALAEALRVVEDLNEVVTDQANRIELLERRVNMLMTRAAEQEADQASGLPLSDQRPPHY